MEYLNQLNQSQRMAVEATEGPVMVIAGAGSGKTKVLTNRIAHIINKGVDPFNILALTFTNKAAKEMKGRIEKIINSTESRNIWMGTFHSVFAKILRSEAEKIGYPNNFTIYDTQDAKNLIKAILKEQGLDDKIYKPSLVLNRISAAKNNLISPLAYLNDTTVQNEDTQSAKPKLGLIYQIYCDRCFKAGAMDFDDLLYKTNVLLRDYPKVLEKYQNQFKYILVDEYQDTNFSQYLIIRKLGAANLNICVVGDDSQSIYAFRGANIQNIFNFKNDYSNVKTFKLEQNYRSTQNIVNAANSLIKHNKEKIDKTVFTNNEIGNKIKIYRAGSDNDEGNTIANLIFDTQLTNQAKNHEFAILYRTNAQSRAMEEALRKKNIPYKIHGGLSFYQRKEVKDLLAYFRLVINPKDDEALLRIINYPARGIGDTTLEKIVSVANNHNLSNWEIISNLNKYNVGLNSGTQSKIGDFVLLISGFSNLLQTKNAYDLAHEIAATSGLLKDLYSDRTPEGISRYENIQELLNGIKEFTEEENELEEDITPHGLPEFLQNVALLTDADNEKEEDHNKVSLMTIHASKGLEFPYVYIVGLEENLFPSQLSITNRKDLEEERRLFYVAITRAEKELVFSFASSRYKWGNVTFCEPSRFIDEVDKDFLEFMYSNSTEKQTNNEFEFSRNKYFSKSKEINFSNSKQIKEQTPLQTPQQILPKNLKKIAPSAGISLPMTTELVSGMRISHEKFGNGVIEELEDGKATINFDAAGKKVLLLKFAKLTILN
ncbi:MAG: UvrD-helicase domain-containing protein [Flavobacteriales bacterium]|nr:UvrD-helicase domain-containing protein [Flavobacteriales bacterium]